MSKKKKDKEPKKDSEVKKDPGDSQSAKDAGMREPAFSWIGFSVGLAVGILLVGAVLAAFGIHTDRRLKKLEGSSGYILQEKVAKLENAVNTFKKGADSPMAALAGKPETTEDVLRDDGRLEALRKQIIAVEEKILTVQRMAEAAGAEKERATELEKSVAELKASHQKFQTEIEATIVELRQGVAPGGALTDRIAAIETKVATLTMPEDFRPQLQGLREEFEAALKHIEEAVGALKAKVQEELGSVPESLAGQIRQCSDDVRDLKAALDNARGEVQILREAQGQFLEREAKLVEKDREIEQKIIEFGDNLHQISLQQGDIKRLTATSPGGEPGVNSVSFVHLKEDVKSRLLKTITASSTDVKIEFGKLSILAEANAREFKQELIFPEAFASVPAVWAMSAENPRWDIYVQTITKEGCLFIIKSGSRVPEGEHFLDWIAIGKRLE